MRIETGEAAINGLRSVIDRWCAGRSRPQLLDAGCGAQTHIDVDGAWVVGLDASREQLDRNECLHEKILGDVQSYPLPRGRFDLVVCWDVLEHLPNPRAALANLGNGLAPGGLLVLAGPNLFSPKGLVTRFTPYSVHRAWYRRVAPGLTPFRTHLKLSTAPRYLHRWVRRRGLLVRYFVAYEAPSQVALRRRIGLVGRSWDVMQRAIEAASFGLCQLAATDFLLVAEAP